jgi:hypothetical protein
MSKGVVSSMASCYVLVVSRLLFRSVSQRNKMPITATAIICILHGEQVIATLITHFGKHD